MLSSTPNLNSSDFFFFNPGRHKMGIKQFNQYVHEKIDSVHHANEELMKRAYETSMMSNV